MITNRKRPVSILLAVILLFSLTADVFAQGSADTPDQVLSVTAEYLIRQVPEPQYGSVGGAWLILGLCRAGAHIPDGYTQGYADRLGAILKENGGVLGNQRRYTDYSREVLAVTAMGLDARDLAGYDLTAPLGDFDAVVKQGLSGPVWALIALDSGGYPMPAGDEQATRWKYVRYILDAQLPDGGWAYSGRTPADPDMTAMCLTALAGYRGEKRVSAAVQAGVERLSLILVQSLRKRGCCFSNAYREIDDGTPEDDLDEHYFGRHERIRITDSTTSDQLTSFLLAGNIRVIHVQQARTRDFLLFREAAERAGAVLIATMHEKPFGDMFLLEQDMPWQILREKRQRAEL